MPKLEDEIEKLQNSPTLDTNFRLWLTSMSSNKFSINVLKNSIKITMEPPKGLKLNLQRQYDNLNEEELEACSKPELFKSFFFSLCFFHAIVQDRRKFGPVGWNVKYDFTNEDLKVSRMQLKNFLEEYDEVPYKVLNYLVAEINYGGRVTDDKDQRLIQTILLTYLTDKTLQYNAYPYSESGIYYCPKPGPKSTYTDYIKKLPTTTGPEVFGLHDNAEIITAQNEARLLLETLLLMQPRTSSGSGKTMEQSVSETLEIIEKNTPPVFDYEAIKNKFPTDYNESMNTVLIQEVIRYNVLLNLMKVNIQNLKKALSGHIVMDEALDAIVTSIYNNQVPQVWIKSGFLSMKPLMSWIKDLNERITFFNDWHEKGTPTCFCISRFSFPQAFLTGTLQNYARKHKCEIDLLTFEFKIMDDTTWDKVQDKPEDGCYVYGMFLEGARWNYETHLLDNSLNRELYTDVPLIHMIPVPNREPPKTGIYNTPLYKVLSRQGTLSTTGHSTNFVLMVELPTKEDEAKWIKAGVAMFLALKQ
jgi:dynein heavy chain